MKQRPRIYYTAAQKELMWDRWKKGDNLHQIAQLFDRHHPSIQHILAESSGIKPSPRCRSELAFTKPLIDTNWLVAINAFHWCIFKY